MKGTETLLNCAQTLRDRVVTTGNMVIDTFTHLIPEKRLCFGGLSAGVIVNLTGIAIDEPLVALAGVFLF